MKRLCIALLLLGYSLCAYADIIHLLPKSFMDRLDIIDPSIEEAIKRAETDPVYATLFYFMGAVESSPNKLAAKR